MVTSYPPFLGGCRSVDNAKFARGFGQAVITLSGIQDAVLFFVIDILNFIRLLLFNELSLDLLNFLRKEEIRLRNEAKQCLPISSQNMNWHYLLHHLVDQIGNWGSLARTSLYAAERMNGFLRGLIFSRVQAEENVLNTMYAIVSIVRAVSHAVFILRSI